MHYFTIHFLSFKEIWRRHTVSSSFPQILEGINSSEKREDFLSTKKRDEIERKKSRDKLNCQFFNLSLLFRCPASYKFQILLIFSFFPLFSGESVCECVGFSREEIQKTVPPLTRIPEHTHLLWGLKSGKIEHNYTLPWGFIPGWVCQCYTTAPRIQSSLFCV